MKLGGFKKPVYVTEPLIAPEKEVLAKVQEVLRSRWLTNFGTQHKQLEKKLQSYLGCRNLDLFSSGHIALDIAIKALELKGEVITTPFTFASTAHALYLNNIKPVFCDIDPVTYNINPKKIEALITPKTTAILAVHVYGHPCDVVAIQKIATKHNLKVIYDAAHAFGVRYKNKPIGTYGDMSMFSFHATKVFNTIEGGCLVFKDATLARRIYLLKNFGIEGEDRVSIPGMNGKMNELQAGIGLVNLKHVRASLAARKKVAAGYTKFLQNIPGITLPPLLKNTRYNYSYYPVLINQNLFGLSRDGLYAALKDYNIFTRKYFYPLASHFDCYRTLKSAKPSLLPVAERIASSILCLPLSSNLTKTSVQKIAALIKKQAL